MSEQKNTVDEIRESEKLAETHYENFPVISFFIPKSKRKDVALYYRFAREADDIADEGDFTDSERLYLLDEYENALNKALNGEYKTPFWKELALSIERNKLSPENYFNLLKAFKQDVIKKRYKTFDELKDYCRNSANPVGRFILELFQARDAESAAYSDAVCTALQLTNFYQDVSTDFKKSRIYIPLDEMKKFGVGENVFEKREKCDNFKKLMTFQVERTREFFTEGKKLLPNLPKNLKLQITWTVKGGEAILNKIEKLDYDVLNFRPKLSKYEFMILMIKSFVSK
ncbi:MAG: squalene synthase HpnC [Chlorobi bacterium]|nr:squalene synthase HpnC [Chlorobiota bacterium]